MRGPIVAQGDQIWQLQTVRGDRLWWGTIHSVTGPISRLFIIFDCACLRVGNFPKFDIAVKQHSGIMDGVDSRGVKRGNCLDCICKGYDGGSEKKKCVRCEHPPGKHANLSPNQPTRTCTTRSSVSSALSDGFGGQSMYAQCLYPQCTEETYFDLNTREEKPFCKRHLTAQPTKRSDGYTVMPALGSVQGNLAHTGLSVVTMIPAVPATIGSSSSARLSSSQTAGQSQSVSLPVARPISAVVPKQYVNPVMMHTTGE